MKVTISGILFLLFLPVSVSAQGLTFEPINPAFGGNPLNGAFLTTTATLQNQFSEPPAPAAVPDIDFPDIAIDLGELDDTVPDTATPDGTPIAAPTATSDFTVGN